MTPHEIIYGVLAHDYDVHYAEELTEEILKRITEQGLVVAPEKPTAKMLDAGVENWPTVGAMEDWAELIWRSMIAAVKGNGQ